jgi:transcriptional regulator with XRE-family HTH domain
MNDPEETAKNICTAIGQRIRAIRQEHRLTLDDLSLRTGFAKSYLSQIETLKREPPISTLTKIAFVLGVDVFFLISGEVRSGDKKPLNIVRSADRAVVSKPSGSPAYTYEPINHNKTDRLMDGYIITAGSEYPAEPLVHEGQELSYVLEGKQEFFYDGETYIFEKGDAYCFDSNKPHYAKSIGGKPARVLVVFASKK